MLTQNVLLTKIKGTGRPDVQAVLRNLQRQKDRITAIRLTDTRFAIRTEQQPEFLEVGRVKAEYLDFIASLHNPPEIETKVTGGTYLLIDNNTKQPVREVGSLNDFTPTEQIMLMEGEYSFVQKLHGLNLKIESLDKAVA